MKVNKYVHEKNKKFWQGSIPKLSEDKIFQKVAKTLIGFG